MENSKVVKLDLPMDKFVGDDLIGGDQFARYIADHWCASPDGPPHDEIYCMKFSFRDWDDDLQDYVFDKEGPFKEFETDLADESSTEIWVCWELDEDENGNELIDRWWITGDDC